MGRAPNECEIDPRLIRRHKNIIKHDNISYWGVPTSRGVSELDYYRVRVYHSVGDPKPVRDSQVTHKRDPVHSTWVVRKF